jgi:hypothetical protein
MGGRERAMALSGDHLSLRMDTTANLLDEARLRRMFEVILRFAEPPPNRWTYRLGGPVSPFGPDLVNEPIQTMLVDGEGVNLMYVPPRDQWVIPPPRYTRREIEAMNDEQLNLTFYESSLTPDVFGATHYLPRISYSISAKHVRTPEQIEGLLRMWGELFEKTEAVYGFADHSDWQMTVTRVSLFTTSYQPPSCSAWALPGIYWANFFGAPYVAMLSRARLESVPGCRVAWLSGGGALLLLGEAPRPRKSFDKSRKHRDAVKNHLGREYFYHPKDGWPLHQRRRQTPDFDLSQLPTPLHGFETRGDS